MIDYNNRSFRSVKNSSSGEVNEETLFHYKQYGNIVTADYSGGEILKGQLIALADEAGNLDMRYQHLNKNFQLMTGICKSKPELFSNGKLRLHESWQWTSGDNSKGESIIEEI